MFPIEIWNHYDNHKRTNNDLEGYNHKLNRFFNTHPNIWKFIKYVKSEESTATLKFMRIEKDCLRTRGRNKCDTEIDNEILKCKCDYVSGTVDIMTYLERVSKCLHDYAPIE